MGRSLRYFVAGFLLLADTATASGQLVIQELLYDGPGTDGDDVFTELVGPPGLSLNGWSLVGINGDTGATYRTVDLSAATVPADGVLVVATQTAAGEVLAARDLIGSVDWQNGPDAVHLLDAAGIRVDALQYGDAGAFNAGEGFPATAVAAGQSLARDAGAVDTDDNFADFSAQVVPTPGLTAAAGIVVTLPDTVAAGGDSVHVDVRLTGTGASVIVAFEAFVTYNRDVARIVDAELVPSTAGSEWTLVWNAAIGMGTSIDTVKAAAASGSAPLAGDGPLLRLHFDLLSQTAPATTPLTLEHLLFNDGAPEGMVEHGSLAAAGRDGIVTATPQRAIPPDILDITVDDADEDRTGGVDSVTVRVTDGNDSEVAQALESGSSTGLFVVPLAVELGSPIADNGILETAVGRSLAVCYVDSLDAAGQTVERCFDVGIYAGSDGRLEVTQISQPGDTLRVRVVDADLNTNPAVVEFAQVDLLGPASGDREQVVLSEVGADDSTFVGSIVTAFAIGSSGDGTLTTGWWGRFNRPLLRPAVRIRRHGDQGGSQRGGRPVRGRRRQRPGTGV